jgi:hypothetical protein
VIWACSMTGQVITTSRKIGDKWGTPEAGCGGLMVCSPA